MRNWKLQSLDKEIDGTCTNSYERDYSEFIENLEEDESYRQNVNIFYGKKLLFLARSKLRLYYLDPLCEQNISDEMSEVPRIPLEEMLQEMSLKD